MSRFTVGQEITPKNNCVGLTRGKFYRVYGHEGPFALVDNDSGQHHAITDNCALTREEYEQAEKEKEVTKDFDISNVGVGWKVKLDDTKCPLQDIFRGVWLDVVEADANQLLIEINGFRTPISRKFPFFLSALPPEREKDPFAPGKWVVCVKDDAPVKDGDILRVLEASDHPALFRAHDESSECGYEPYRKSHFRPATPEEIKAQEMKIMDEKKADEARANRQTFTVGGREFYVGQSVWVDYGVLGHADGKPLEVVGYIYNTDGLILVRPSDALFIIQLRVDGLMTEPPKPHEWKFRDWARHPEHGVVMAVLVGKGVTVANDSGYYNVDKDSLTYISTAEIPE